MDSKSSLSDPSLEQLLKGHKGAVTGLSFNHDSTQLVSSSSDTSLMLWNFKKKSHAIKYESHTDSVTGVHFAPNGKLMVSCSKDRDVRLWKPTIKRRCQSFRAHTSAIRSIHVSPDSATLLSASNDKNIKLWTSEHHNKFISTLHGHNHWVNCARFSWNGKLVISCSEDKSIKLWDRLSNCCIHTLEEDCVPKWVEFHPSDKCVGVGFSNNLMKIYDIRQYNLIQYYPVHAGTVNQIAFHPNGNFMISGSNDQTIKVCDLIEGHVIYTLEGHDGPVTSVTFSADGRTFASGGADKTVLVWKTNFDTDLARPLDTSSNLKMKEIIKEKIARTVDARLSFSGMQGLDIEVTSCEPDSSDPPEDICDGVDEFTEQQNNKLSSRESGVSTESNTLAGGDGLNINGNDELTPARIILQSLKQDVKNIQSQLSAVMLTLEELEERTCAMK